MRRGRSTRSAVEGAEAPVWLARLREEFQLPDKAVERDLRDDFGVL